MKPECNLLSSLLPQELGEPGGFTENIIYHCLQLHLRSSLCYTGTLFVVVLVELTD